MKRCIYFLLAWAVILLAQCAGAAAGELRIVDHLEGAIVAADDPGQLPEPPAVPQAVRVVDHTADIVDLQRRLAALEARCTCGRAPVPPAAPAKVVPVPQFVPPPVTYQPAAPPPQQSYGYSGYSYSAYAGNCANGQCATPAASYQARRGLFGRARRIR